MRIGIDLGGTKTEIIALDNLGQTLLRQRTSTPDTYSDILNNIVSMIHQCESELKQTGSVGLGIPGCISPTTRRVKNANTTCLIGKPLDQDLQYMLNRPIRIANDADCFALSEFSDGAGEDFNSIFCVIIGTGTGGGLIINNQLVQGPNAIAGEWGHNPLPWPTHKDLPQQNCYCGKKGCIETYLSGPGMSKQFELQHQKTLNSREIIQAIDSNKSDAKEYWQEYLDRMARSLASVINIVDPQAIILGGGMSNIDRLYKDLPEKLLPYVFSDACTTPIFKAKHGDSSGVRGAAWLWD